MDFGEDVAKINYSPLRRNHLNFKQLLNFWGEEPFSSCIEIRMLHWGIKILEEKLLGIQTLVK